MQSSLSFLIGWRYLRAKRRNAFISFVSLFAFLGMAIGVFALIVVLSVMNGFDRELKERILRTVPHGFIEPNEGLQDSDAFIAQLHGTEGIEGLAPFVKTTGLLVFAGNARGVEILGIDPALEPAVSDVHAFMTHGLMNQLRAGEYNVVMGSLLAHFLGLNIGDKVTLTLPELNITPAGVFPRSRRFTLVGTYNTGAQSDQQRIFIHLRDGQKLLRLGNASQGLRVKTADIYQAPSILKRLRSDLGQSTDVTDWTATQGHLFQAVKMEKTVVGFLLGIIIAVAAFNIVTSLIMMIAEKRSDIAVLRTMGFSSRGVVGVFMVQGLTLGVVGVLLGALFGVAGALSISNIVAAFEQMLGLQLFDPTVYFVTNLPSQWRWQDTLLVCSGALIVSALASAYPAYRASQIAPAEALRYDI